MAWPTLPGQPAVGSAAQASWADAVIQALAVFGSASSAYTPAWTSSGTAPSLGNGSLVGSYWQFGKLVIGAATLTIGSTTSGGTGVWYLTLPVTAKSSVGYQDPIGTVFAKQGTPSAGAVAINSATTMQFLTAAGVAMGATVPAAWANGNSLRIQFMYESA